VARSSVSAAAHPGCTGTSTCVMVCLCLYLRNTQINSEFTAKFSLHNEILNTQLQYTNKFFQNVSPLALVRSSRWARSNCPWLRTPVLCVCVCVRMRVCVCVRDCVRVRVRVRHLGNEGRLVLSNSLLLLFCRFLLRLLTHLLEVVLLLNNLFDGSPFQDLVRLFHAFLGSLGFLLLALVVRNSLRVTCVLENRNFFFFCDFGGFANMSGFASIFTLFFLEILFLHLLPLVFPHPKQCQTPQKYPSYTMQGRSTQCQRSTHCALFRRFFKKKCFLG